MENNRWASGHFVHLKEQGFCIDECYIDFALISVRCSDLARYRKAFRVRIRALMKAANADALGVCIDRFYRFAQFVQDIYGFHSCGVSVETWQEQVAQSLQKHSDKEYAGYEKGSWLTYEKTDAYRQRLQARYQRLFDPIDIRALHFIQDEKPFLTLKDRAHFDRWYRDDDSMSKIPWKDDRQENKRPD